MIYDAGQTIPTETATKLLLTLGNDAVQMKVNGKPVPVAASSTAIGFELLPGSHHDAAAVGAAALRMTRRPRCQCRPGPGSWSPAPRS